MSILIRRFREGVAPAGARRALRPSVREVCLLGVSRPAASWASGDRLAWDGRLYRVEATQGRPGAEADEQEMRYVYLSAPDGPADAGRAGG